MRKHYIDNIRSIVILILFPFHTCMVYNSFESFYIHVKEIPACDTFVVLNYMWTMPILFFAAGMSSFIALNKRTYKEYIKERVSKLLIPLIFGILFIIPVQTFFAEKYHNNYMGSYLQQYILFFTKDTDLTGYSGGFTPAHLWFILYLLIISLLAIPAMKWLQNNDLKIFKFFVHPIKVIILFLVPFLFNPILNIAGKSVGQFFSLFILGFLFMKYEDILDMVDENRLKYMGLAVINIAIYYIIYRTNAWKDWSTYRLYSILYSGLYNLMMWCSILAVLGLGKRYINSTNKISRYLRNSSFSLYLFHQSWLVVIAYFVVNKFELIPLQFALIVILSLITTIITYEIFSRIPVTRYMFGIKRQKNNRLRR